MYADLQSPVLITTAVVIYSVVLLLAWFVAFLRGMFPYFENSILVDLALMCAAGLALAAIPIAMLCSLGHDNPHAVRRPFTWRLLAVTLLALGGTVLLVMGFPVMLGTRADGRLEIGLKPVRDLQDSPAVARIAAAREYAQLPKEAWPAPLSAWNTHVRSVEVIPHRRGPPYDFKLQVERVTS